MRALVVYESFFGNTEKVAQAIKDGLSGQCDVELVDVAKASELTTEPFDLLVVGGPTHAFAMSRVSTREEAVSKGASQGSTTLGLREWLEHLEKGAAKMARGLGYPPAAQAESFYVGDVTGPLLDGELERARAWGEWLAKQWVPAG